MPFSRHSPTNFHTLMPFFHYRKGPQLFQLVTWATETRLRWHAAISRNVPTLPVVKVCFCWLLRATQDTFYRISTRQRRDSHQSTILKSLLPSNCDLFYHIKKFINQHWFALWKTERTKGKKLARLKDTSVPWNSSNLQTRSQEITLTRITHTYLSHLSPHVTFMPSLR